MPVSNLNKNNLIHPGLQGNHAVELTLYSVVRYVAHCELVHSYNSQAPIPRNSQAPIPRISQTHIPRIPRHPSPEIPRHTSPEIPRHPSPEIPGTHSQKFPDTHPQNFQAPIPRNSKAPIPRNSQAHIPRIPRHPFQQCRRSNTSEESTEGHKVTAEVTQEVIRMKYK